MHRARADDVDSDNRVRACVFVHAGFVRHRCVVGRCVWSGCDGVDCSAVAQHAVDVAAVARRSAFAAVHVYVRRGGGGGDR